MSIVQLQHANASLCSRPCAAYEFLPIEFSLNTARLEAVCLDLGGRQTCTCSECDAWRRFDAIKAQRISVGIEIAARSGEINDAARVFVCIKHALSAQMEHGAAAREGAAVDVKRSVARG